MSGDPSRRRHAEANRASTARPHRTGFARTRLMRELQKLVGGNIRRIRLRRALSQEELASRSGMDRAAIPLIENGTFTVTLAMVETLALALNVGPAAFFAGAEPPPDDAALPAQAERRSDAPRATNRHIGNRLRCIRTQQDLSQEMLGHLLGVPAAELHRYESGTDRVPSIVLVRLATILNVHLSAFVTE
jgi:transcriptional regulator with XRE-family HTH domain